MTTLDVRAVVAASVVSCAIGAACGYILTKQRMTAQYELLIEEEVKKAKEYYQTFPPEPENDGELDTVEVLVTDQDTLVETTETLEVSDEETDNDRYLRKKDRTAYHKIAANYDAPAVQQAAKIKPNIGEGIEAYEARVAKEGRNLVNDILNRVEPELLDDSDVDGDGVVHANLFDTHGVSDDTALDMSTRSAEHPYVISYDEYEEAEGDFSQTSLTYYEGDNVLTDERDQPINDIDTVVGDNNLQFGLASGDKNIVFVRNHQLEADFEIARDHGYYSQEVLGVAPPERGKGQE